MRNDGVGAGDTDEQGESPRAGKRATFPADRCGAVIRAVLAGATQNDQSVAHRSDEQEAGEKPAVGIIAGHERGDRDDAEGRDGGAEDGLRRSVQRLH